MRPFPLQELRPQDARGAPMIAVLLLLAPQAYVPPEDIRHEHLLSMQAAYVGWQLSMIAVNVVMYSTLSCIHAAARTPD